jgi:small-conductance mechanosensitive channel
MKDLSEFLEFTLFKVGQYKLNVGMLFAIAFVIVFNYILLFVVKYIIHKQESKNHYTQNRMLSIFLLIKYISWIFVFSIILSILKVKLTFLLAGSAAIMVGLGLGVQQIFKDIVSGIFILVDGTIKVNDVLEVDNIVGRVTDIKLRTSEIITRDGINIIVPNGRFISENVINWSHHEKIARFSVEVGVAYNSDVELVKKLLLETATENINVIKDDKDKRILVRIDNFGDNSIHFSLLFWTKIIFRVENTKSDLRYAIFKKFKEHNIQIPFPQRDVHIISKS